MRSFQLLAFAAATVIFSGQQILANEGWRKFTATAYAEDGTTASGKQTVNGRTAAADPAVLPLGTRVEVRGAGPYSGEYTIHDSGPKVNGREIDLFVPSHAEAKRFGKKTVQVRVVHRAPHRK